MHCSTPHFSLHERILMRSRASSKDSHGLDQLRLVWSADWYINNIVRGCAPLPTCACAPTVACPPGAANVATGASEHTASTLSTWSALDSQTLPGAFVAVCLRHT